MKRLVISSLVFIGFAVPATLGQTSKLVQKGKLETIQAERQTGFDSITAEQCNKWLSYLASDEMEGRATGRPGFERAARFIAKEFKRFGLKAVAKDGTYFQMVPFKGSAAIRDKSYIELVSKRGKVLKRIKIGEGLGGTINEKSDREFDLAFLAAFSAKDVQDADMDGKAVLMADYSKPARRGTEARRALFRKRSTTFFRIDDAAGKKDPSASLRVRYAGGRSGPSGIRRRPNSYALTREAAATLLALADNATLPPQDGEPEFRTFDGIKLRVHIEIETKDVFACNVVGFLEGSDPILKKEIIGIGSHLDHLGMRAGVVYNGADDDGSGTTGVLAVARAFTLNKRKPKRSILFMTFCGEEMGMIGSRYYVDNPIFDNKQMVAELQMDMIGRNEEKRGELPKDNLNSLHLVGTKKLSDELHALCLEQNKKFVGFDFEYDEESVFSRSDHVSFARKNIPIAFFFTGFHPQYHRPNDTVDRINFPKLARVAKLVYAIAFELAERPKRPKVDRTYTEAMGRRNQGVQINWPAGGNRGNRNNPNRRRGNAGGPSRETKVDKKGEKKDPGKTKK